MGRLGNITSVNYVYLNPIFTLITAMIFLGERMTPAAGVGAILIMAGVILAGQRGNSRSSRRVHRSLIRTPNAFLGPAGCESASPTPRI